MYFKNNHGHTALTTSINMVIFGVSAIGVLPHTAVAHVKQNDNLKKLSQYYHTDTDSTSRCHGSPVAQW